MRTNETLPGLGVKNAGFKSLLCHWLTLDKLNFLVFSLKAENHVHFTIECLKEFIEIHVKLWKDSDAFEIDISISNR